MSDPFTLKRAVRLNIIGAGLAFDEARRCLWTRAKLRKPAVCWPCGSKMDQGAVAWRPFGNVDFRYRRVCDDCAKMSEG